MLRRVSACSPFSRDERAGPYLAEGRASGVENQVESKPMLFRSRAELQELKAEWKRQMQNEIALNPKPIETGG